MTAREYVLAAPHAQQLVAYLSLADSPLLVTGKD